MNNEEFINQIAPYVVEWHHQFNFGVPSAIIAQACLESGYGQSNKAQHHNYFGLKYRLNRVQCYSEIFTDTSYEQNPDGTYVPIITQWYGFINMDMGVDGYFQFIDTGKYDEAKKATTPEAYLQGLKNAGYATSQKYVDNVMAVVNKYNLTQYDGGTTMYTNSPLVTYVDLSPHNYGPRQSAEGITIHHMAGNLSVQTCGQIFHKKNASSNYGVNGKDVGLYCEEKYAACTSSNKANDMRMITIEVANELLAPYWTISAESMTTLINLCTDICKRNGIKQLVWSENKSDRVGHKNGCNMTLHCDFASTACPGPFLKQCMGNIALAVNTNLNGGVIPTPGSDYVIDGVDYSLVFNPIYYKEHNSDVANSIYGANDNTLWEHFKDFGMGELRQGCENFNPKAYKDRYEDLRNAYGEDNQMYYWHWIVFGKNEGRIAN